ncbi:AMP-binding protein [Arthrobacter sp. 35W]|uniref:AMP-binding protein n=1 Tax=Arthrobacter sp. 35W TaxID=1132441 RepID=UPI00040F36E4|nr:AMP-binding protein [Arthrobacter sp. 35W]
MAEPERIQDLLDTFGASDASAAFLLCDRHPASSIAFTVVQPDLGHTDITYGELREKSARFAVALAGLGVGPGDRVATLMSKSADLVVALLGIWRRGAIDVPLFTAFAGDAIAFRLASSGAKLVIADADQRRKLVPSGDVPMDASPLVVVARGEAFGYDLAFDELLAGQTPVVAGTEAHDPTATAVGGDGVLAQLFTSGTTGEPKAVPIPLRAVASFVGYLEFGLDVRPSDVYWNAADPGWAYGLYFALLAPLATGTRSILLDAGFSSELAWAVMERFGVTNFAAAPTAYRVLRAGAPVGHQLRRASSAGEPLTPDVIDWSRGALGVEVHDHYGQTEHGMVAGNAWAEGLQQPLRAGSMGTSLPGWHVEVLDPLEDVRAADGEPGRVAIDVAASPFLWFTGYVGAPEKTATRFTADGRWYVTGDAGRRDGGGFIYFSSRDDDVIIMAGYRIGPFDVESVLAAHPDVDEAAVIGAPDELRGEVLEAFVVLREGVAGSDAMAAGLQQLVKEKFAAHAYPRRIHFVERLPKTPSGKVQRFVLRRQRAAMGASEKNEKEAGK